MKINVNIRSNQLTELRIFAHSFRTQADSKRTEQSKTKKKGQYSGACGSKRVGRGSL